VFTYKNYSDDYLIKYKARIVIRNDLQNADPQNLYAATLASKIFRVFMTLMTDYSLKIRQLNAVNAFLNAHNDKLVYCQMLNYYKLSNKYYKIIKALYDRENHHCYECEF
jgi:hypothetical protein